METKQFFPSIQVVMIVSEPIAEWAEKISKVANLDPSVVLNAMLIYAYKEVLDKNGNFVMENFDKLAVDIAILSQTIPFKEEHDDANHLENSK